MKVVHALHPLERSIFLAGPTPRDDRTPSWRPEALAILQEKGFDGTVFVPEHETWASHDDYDAQVKWEIEALNRSTAIVFWVPRVLGTMPAFTTNVEFGMYLKSGRAVLGYPEGAPKMAYLKSVALSFGVPVVHDLPGAIDAALRRVAELAP